MRLGKKLSHTSAFHSSAFVMDPLLVAMNSDYLAQSTHHFTYGSTDTLDNGLLVRVFKLRQIVKLDKQGTL